MDRRAFLRFLGGTAAGAAIATTLDLERLLWVPGAKRIFVPDVRVMRDLQTGIGIRLINHYDIQSDKRPTRIDWFYTDGWTTYVERMIG